MMSRWNMYRAGFTPKTIDVGDFQFCYMERGLPSDTNQTIVLIHGFAASKDAWCYMSHALPKTEHIIALDLPGHGKSTRKHDGDHTIPTQVAKLHQFVHAIGLHQRKFHLAGISMGGHIVGVYASRHPSNLSSVIMMCPAGIDAPHLSEFLEDVLHKGERNYLIPETTEDFLTMWKKVVHRYIPLPYFAARLFTEVRKPFNEFYKKVLLDITHPDHRFLLQNVLEDITVPALVLWGENDKIIHVSSVNVMKEKLKNSQVHILDRCGHALSLERPWKTAKLMMEFISSCN
ncbi:Monoacylglycerol lipase abhd6-A [Exaiptasia diaphana]|nr:Monoacylglycerol lipase abhd6-A [Exaiptasia diaphana]